MEHLGAQKRISLSTLTPLIISFTLPKISSTRDLCFQLLLDISTWRSKRHVNLKPVRNRTFALFAEPTHLIFPNCKLQFHSCCCSGLKFSFSLSSHPVPHIGSTFSIPRESDYISQPPQLPFPSQPPPTSHLGECQSFLWGLSVSTSAHFVSILNTIAGDPLKT